MTTRSERGVVASAGASPTLQQRERGADLGAIAAAIVHELVNPLAALSLQAQLVLRRAGRGGGRPANSVREPAERMIAEVRRLDDLLKRLMAAAEPHLECETAELSALVRDVVTCWQLDAGRRAIDIPLTPHAPMTVRADARLLRTVLDAVVENAIEAIGIGPGRIDIALTAAASDRVGVVVEDDGPGIADPGKVFRLLGTTKPGRLGLGLAVARQIMFAHGGSLTFAPRTPRGTVFTIELPR